eukprot:gene3506-1872_t
MPAAANDTDVAAKFVSAEEAAALLRAEHKCIDVRDIGCFAASHFAGAVCIPAGVLEERLYELPCSSVPLVVVAAGEAAATEVLKLLRRTRRLAANSPAERVVSRAAVAHVWQDLCARDATVVVTGPAEGVRLWCPSPLVERCAADIERRLGAPGTVADVGCGHGRDMAFLTRRGWRASGADN